jgi:hypothetical protein
MNEKTKAKSRRTVGIWLVALIFAFAALLGGLRVYAAIEYRANLTAVAESINIPYLIISGGLTGLGGLFGLGVVFLRRFWVPKAALITGTGLSLLYWFDQFVFVENTTYIGMAWGFSLLMNVILLGVIAWMLTRKKTQLYYTKKELE